MIRGSTIVRHSTKPSLEPTKPLMPRSLTAGTLCYDRAVNRRALVLFAVQALAAVPLRAADDPLARARVLYNQHQFDAAVNEAEKARVIPSRADAADLIAARA